MSRPRRVAPLTSTSVRHVGIGNQQEHEGIDRHDTLLPGLQGSFAQQVLALGKPTTVVLINGGIVSIDSLVDKAHAIVEVRGGCPRF